ncbi:HET-domain-containing protein [Plenodomus tracheiphilus IPT5]|uniref:HET-domain-containing protein n=1 Tax=Plenodomus tracheiphilus IPT5 TaxID=1408161 RepID=A0A6A7B3M6_9PLEO|nr:HET-domain-containing protein [Plenodomus tracheiphilus IPT5]
MATIDIVEEERRNRTPLCYTEAGRYARFSDYTFTHDTNTYWSDSPHTQPCDSANSFIPPFIHDVATDRCARIRLLRVLPRTPNDDYSSPPRCELISFDMSSAPPYIALSYTWGHENCPKHESYINGRLREDIWENLFNFIRHVRQGSFNLCGKYLWIDQLCINMKSKTDRGYNVNFMSEIYKGANQVVSWLGISASTVRATERIKMDCASSHDIATLLNNRYFTRLWIVPEILLAQQVYFMCGNTWFSLAKLEESARHHGTRAIQKSGAYYLL